MYTVLSQSFSYLLLLVVTEEEEEEEEEYPANPYAFSLRVPQRRISSSSIIYYFDREGPTDVAVLLQNPISA